jgi:hypothetical protein
MFTGIVYKTTNLINGKIYVGQDSKNRPNYKGSGLLINHAFKKYGRQQFVKEILEQCSSKEHMIEREKFWIDKLNSRNRSIGYNISSGGEFGDTLSMHPKKKEIFDKISVTKQTIQQNGKTSAQNSADKAAKTMKTTVLENGLTIYQNSAVKCKLAVSRVQENGKTIAENSADKAAKTMKTTVLENGKTIYENTADKISMSKYVVQENGKTVGQNAGLKGANTRKTTIESNGKTIQQNISTKITTTVTTTIQENGKTIAQNVASRGANTRKTTIESNDKTIAQNMSKRSAKTMKTTVLENGLTIYQNSAVKCNLSKLRKKLVSMHIDEATICFQIDSRRQQLLTNYLQRNIR